ncbi:hypothetical protein COB21_03590 [Candidatus Aerophobetes bacterium]|uniref:CARDB domain-containing protein n=1 Tax=Aerophobetes bacterium TaxID=2030807 RepID=A0A2A4X4Q3_UNCAE|nr:MAG: hypothetical protein COB21_03590 [Candidatus Aerophobetes bacterium]
MKFFYFFLLCVTTPCAFATDSAVSGQISVTALQQVDKPPHFSKSVKILFPRVSENKKRNPVNVQLQVTASNESLEDKCFAVFMDNHPPFRVEKKVGHVNSRKALVSFFLPLSLERGQHLIRIFSIDSQGIMLDKNAQLNSCSFYFLDPKKSSETTFDDANPILSLLSPYPSQSHILGQHILLDVHFSDKNKQVADPKVVLSIDNQFVSLVTSDQVYKIEGLGRGEHRIRLVLYDGKYNYSNSPLTSCDRMVTVN